MRKPRYLYSATFLFLSVVFKTLKECSCSSASGGLSVSPIEHLEASVAASSAHASVAAVRSLQDNEEYVVIVTFKPSAKSILQQRQSQVNKKLTQQSRFGLKLSRLDDTAPAAFNRWTQLGGSSMCAMTGFASDVQHLTGVTLNQVESHQALYSHAMSVESIVRQLALVVQRAARSQGGRPFGVQALIVGLDVKGKFQLYTVDPTGGWLHYGGGATAVGRGAQDVRALLYTALKSAASTRDDDSSEALRVAISSLIGKSLKDDDKNEDYSSKLEALLVWKSETGSCCVSKIGDTEIDACLKRIKESE